MTDMRKEKRNILIHCAAGISRSSTFTIAYLMKDREMPFHKALDYVKERRRWINPNSGFRRQLIDYNQELGLEAPPP
jgi:protein-tyrosine phosphatase